MRKKLSEHFFEDEFACPKTGECFMRPWFIERLELLRTRVGVPFVIGSGYRSRAYNEQLALRLGGVAPKSLHPEGIATDISHEKWNGKTKFAFIREASAMGFSIGIYKKHFHIDLRPAPSVLWIERPKPAKP